MTELKNLASMYEFGEFHDSLLTYKIVDGIRSEKIRGIAEQMIIDVTGKTIKICSTNEIAKMQMKERESNNKEVNGINKRKLWKAS